MLPTQTCDQRAIVVRIFWTNPAHSTLHWNVVSAKTVPPSPPRAAVVQRRHALYIADNDCVPYADRIAPAFSAARQFRDTPLVEVGAQQIPGNNELNKK